MEYEDLTNEQKKEVKIKMELQNEMNMAKGYPIWTDKEDFFQTIKELFED